MSTIQGQLSNFIKLLGRLSFNQKIALGTLIIGSVAAVGLFYTQGQRDMDVLFSNLDPVDASAIVHNLRKEGVPYQIANDGATILVPRSRKEDLRLDAFKDDLIKSDNAIGFDALGSLPFGLTSWQEKKYDQKMISDEVVKTLEKIEGIKKARVILAQPEESAFSSENVIPSASVMLIVEPGFRLKADQVKTIKQLVAHSVPDLTPDQVSVADSNGNLLNDDLAGGGTGDGLTEIEKLRQSFEQRKSHDIQELLAPIAGPGNAVVKVSVQLNFDQTQSKVKRLIPNGGNAENPTGIPVSVQQAQEDYNGNKQGSASGQPGVASNTPSIGVTPVQTSSQGADNKGNYKNQNVVTNYEISSEEKTTVEAPGKVEKLSVAVVINKVLTQDETAELKNLIISAGGLEPNRGDSVSISGISFSPEAAKALKNAQDSAQQDVTNTFLLSLAQLAGVFGLGIIGLFVFYKLLQGIGGEEDEEDAEYELVPRDRIGSNGEYDTDEVDEDGEPRAPLPPPVLQSKLDPETEYMRDSLAGMVQASPQETAKVLQSFLHDS